MKILDNLNLNKAKEFHQDFLSADTFIFRVILTQWLVLSSFGAMFHDTYFIGFIGGGLLSFVAFIGYKFYKGTITLRIVNAVILMLFSIILIQQNAGGIEMHFHIFAMIAFLVIYKDIIPLTIATLFIIVHHLFFTYLQLNNVMIFGSEIIIFNDACGYDIALLHAFFVVLQWLVLVQLSLNNIVRHWGMIEERKLLKALLDSQEQLIITTDGQELISANETFLNFYAVDSIDDFKKTYKVDCVCDTFNTNVLEGYLQKMMGRETWIDYVVSHSFDNNHKVMLTRGEQDFIFSVTAAKLPGDNELKSAVFTDITEMEKAKLNLENVTNTIQDLIFYKDLDLKFIGLNDACCELIGKKRDEIIGKTDFDFFPDDVAKLFTDMDKKILKSGESLFFEEEAPDKDGNILYFATQKHVLKDANNHIYGIVGSIRDITVQKKAEIELKSFHKQTRESIEYASLIQGALITDNKAFRNYFQDYFIIWHPKDTVGGDIYLFEELRDKDECLLFVIDCTGHGVPGAFVTMLVKAIERQIIAKINNDHTIEVSPSWILSYFNKHMKQLLKQEDKDSISNAGFDGGIIYYNKKKQVLKFAGAETPLFYIEDDELKTIKGSRHSVGYKKSDVNYEFKEYIINVKEGMKFYLTTDGYLDQNGGEKSFPFGKKNFKNIVNDNYKKTLVQQQEIFLEKLTEYQGNEETNDDVTLIGFII